MANTGAGEWAIDSILLPLTIRMYRKAQRILRSESNESVGIMRRQSSTITVTAGTTNLQRVAGTTYPSDMLRPLMMRERAPGVQPFTEMKTQGNFMPDQAATVKFEIFDWRDDMIWFPEAAGSREVQVLYEATLTDLTAVGSTIAIQDLLDPLALMVASVAIKTRDEKSQSEAWWAEAVDDLHLIIKCEQAAKQARGKTWGVS